MNTCANCGNELRTCGKTRQYADDAEEAASIIAWTERRLAVASDARTVARHLGTFKRMWSESFGTLDNVPQTFKDRVTAQYEALKEGGESG